MRGVKYKGGAVAPKHGTCIIVYSDLDFFEDTPVFQTRYGIKEQNDKLFEKLAKYIELIIEDKDADVLQSKLYKNRDMIQNQMSHITDLYTFKNARIPMPMNVQRSNRSAIHNKRTMKNRVKFMSSSLAPSVARPSVARPSVARPSVAPTTKNRRYRYKQSAIGTRSASKLYIPQNVRRNRVTHNWRNSM